MIMELLSTELNWNLWCARDKKSLSVYQPGDQRFDEIFAQNPGMQEAFTQDHLNVFATLFDGGSPPIPDGWHPAAVNFIELCFIKDPEKRAKVTHVVCSHVSHRFEVGMVYFLLCIGGTTSS